MENIDFTDIAKRNRMAEKILKRKIAETIRLQRPKVKIIRLGNKKVKVAFGGYGVLNTKFGKFYLCLFHINDKWKEYQVVIRAEEKARKFIFKKPHILFRIDSGCYTSVYGDRTCDCREQLFNSMAKIAEYGEGIIICIGTQEGRGLGMEFKLGTLMLQDKFKLNTIEAFLLLSNFQKIEAREYSNIPAILKFLGIGPEKTIDLMTNNPAKINSLVRYGYTVNRAPSTIKPNKFTEKHLRSKAHSLKHTITEDAPNLKPLT